MKPFESANDNLIDRTLETWQPRAGRELDREDVREIVENVTGFFSVLAEWAQAEMSTPANDNDPSSGDMDDEVRHDG